MSAAFGADDREPCLWERGGAHADRYICSPFSLTRFLGSGSTSSVHAAKRKGGGSQREADVALKLVRVQVPREVVLREVRTLSRVQGHPNIVKFHGFFFAEDNKLLDEDEHDVSPYKFALAFELSQRGDLFEHLQAVGPMSEASAAPLFADLLAALQHIHGCGVVHRDVKPENLMFADDGRLLLADFGTAALLSDEEELGNRSGSPGYAAPELCRGQSYGVQVDCFSAGVVLFSILSFARPFGGETATDVVRATVRCTFSWPAKLETASSSSKDLITKLLEKRPTRRLTAKKALRHQWFMEWASVSDSPAEAASLASAPSPLPAEVADGAAETAAAEAEAAQQRPRLMTAAEDEQLLASIETPPSLRVRALSLGSVVDVGSGALAPLAFRRPTLLYR